MKRTVIIAAMLIFAVRADAQGVDSCLTLWQNVYCTMLAESLCQNSDSAMVDTCNASPATPSLDADYYLRFGWVFVFEYDVLPLDSVNADSTLIVSWQSIGTNYPAIRDSFQKMEIKYGPIKLQKAFPNEVDSTIQSSNFFGLILNSYFQADSVLQDLENVPLVTEARYSKPAALSSVEMAIPQSHIGIWPQPCNGDLYIQGQGLSNNISFYDPLGRQIKLPVESTDGLLTIDVSNLPSEVLYANVLGQFFKILIQK